MSTEAIHIIFGCPLEFKLFFFKFIFMNINHVLVKWKCEISFWTNFSLSLVPVDDIMKQVFRWKHDQTAIFIFTLSVCFFLLLESFRGFSHYFFVLFSHRPIKVLQWVRTSIWDDNFAEVNENRRRKKNSTFLLLLLLLKV